MMWKVEKKYFVAFMVKDNQYYNNTIQLSILYKYNMCIT